MYRHLFASMETWYGRWYPPGRRVVFASIIGLSVLAIINISSIAFVLDELGYSNLTQAWWRHDRYSFAPWCGLIVTGHAALAYALHKSGHAVKEVRHSTPVLARAAVLYMTFSLLAFLGAMTYVSLVHDWH